VGIVVHRLGEQIVDKASIDRMGMVDEDDGFAPTELCLNGVEVLMPEIMTVLAISGKQCAAVCFQIECIRNYC